jgi:hypothetical protein
MFKRINLIDLVCQKLLTGRTTKDWISTKELKETLLKLNLCKNDAAEVTQFMEKYFMELDLEKKHFRIKTWAIMMFNIK